jgi:dihydrofolate reductase
VAYAGKEVVINGGAEIYARAMAHADALDITHVHRDVGGDTFFPAIDLAQWRATWREDHDEFSFVTYARV